MFLRTAPRATPKRARHTWMLLMMDECATLAPARIAPLVHSSFELTNPSSSSPSRTSRTASTPSSSPPALDEAPGERAHAWVAVARLLCEGGHWARAAAVLDGLPASAQQPARHKAVRDDWLLPAAVREAWRRGRRLSAAAPAAASPAVTTAAPPQAPHRADEVQSHTASPPTPLPRQSPQPPSPPLQLQQRLQTKPKPPPQQQRRVLSSCRTEELVRMAYDLRRSPRRSDAAAHSAPPHAAAAASEEGHRRARPSNVPPPVFHLKAEMTSILAELQRRGAVAEAVQCVVNWQRRQLTLPDTEEAAAASSAAAAAAHNDTLDSAEALKALLFPEGRDTRTGTASSGLGSAVAAFAPVPSDGRETLTYAAAHVRVVKELAGTLPTVLARCLRDRAVVDRLLRYTDEEVVLEIATTLLQYVAQSSTGRRPSPTAGVHVADAQTCWRAVAALLLPLHQHLRAQPKLVKERLLAALIAALAGTSHVISAPAESSAPRLEAPTAASDRVRRPPPDASPSPACLSEAARQAIKSAVESACSPLLAHEPQVRFLRLHTFGALATALVGLRVPVPNALAQCLFHCMADTNTNAASDALAALSSGRAAHARDAVVDYLSRAPEQRWGAALAMLAEARAASTYHVTAAHARALLSGLQSISLPRTWAAALRILSVLEVAYGVMPDERSLPTVLLNLKQQSWQDAFRVLRYVPGGAVDGAAPPLLRDLQLVALKHASWEVPLRLMTHLQHRHADGFMNYLYCLCAAARGGDAARAFDAFAALQRGRGRHTALQAVSPYNEVTVAVAAVAMLDCGHPASLARFCALVEGMPRAADSAATGDGAAAPAPGPTGVDASNASSSTPLLTEEGWHMALAAHLSALLVGEDDTALLSVLRACPATALPAVLRWMVVLQCLLGLGHLHAPVRLVFDVVGHRAAAATAAAASTSPAPSAPTTAAAAAAAAPSSSATATDADAPPAPPPPVPLADFMRAVTAEQLRYGTYETRQRGTVQQRQHLYIPITHQRAQKKALATRWGRLVKAQEAALPPHTERIIAELMVSEGVGTEYLTAALL